MTCDPIKNSWHVLHIQPEREFEPGTRPKWSAAKLSQVIGVLQAQVLDRPDKCRMRFTTVLVYGEGTWTSLRQI